MSNPAFPSDSPTGLTPDECRAAVQTGLQRGDVAVAIVSGPRSGKTALCRALAASTDERAFATGLFDPLLDPDAVLLQLLNDFGLVAGRPTEEAAHQRDVLRGAVLRFLRSLRPLGAHAVVVVDDADQVGVDVLALLVRLAQDASVDGGAPLRLVLVGQPVLNGRLVEAPLREWPAAGAGWTRLQLAYDDALVPVLPPETPFVASPEPPVDEPVPAAPPSTRLPVLLVLLLVAGGAGVWWWTTQRTDAPATASAQPPAAAPVTAPPAPQSAAGATESVPAAGGAGQATASPAGTGASPSSPSAPSATGTPAAPATATAVTGTTGSGPQYRITVASFRTAGRAEQVAGDLKARQISVWTRVDATGSWHQVMAGPFPSIEAARDTQRQLENAGFPETQIALAPTPAAGTSAPASPSPAPAVSPANTPPAVR